MNSIKCAAALVCVLVAGCIPSPCFADGAPVWQGQLLLTDGVSLLPNARVATPAEVAAVVSGAAAARAEAQAAARQAAELRATATRIDAQAAALDGAMIVYGSCVAFGAEAVVAPTNVSATVAGFAFPSNDTSFVELFVHYSEAMEEVWPMVATSLDGEWERAEPVESVFGSWVVNGLTVEAYRMLVPTGEADAMFFRGEGDVLQSVVGQLNVLGGLTINGREGMTITNSIGVFHQGILIEPMPDAAAAEGGDEQ